MQLYRRRFRRTSPRDQGSANLVPDLQLQAPAEETPHYAALGPVMSVDSAQPSITQPPATIVCPLSVELARGAQDLPEVPLFKPVAGAVAGAQQASYPPQSAAYPAMPAQNGSQSASPVARPGAQAKQSVAAADGRQTGFSAVKQAVPEQDIAPVGDDAEGVVIAGRKGCPEGTIAIPADQTPVPWPTVSGAPLGYPGLYLRQRLHSHTSMPARLNVQIDIGCC